MAANKIDRFNNDLVIAKPNGAPERSNRISANFGQLLRHQSMPHMRFHDTRHTYAVNALRAGDDVKTVQGNLGHATAAFTLDRYGHVTERMRRDSAARMESFIKNALNL